MDPYKGKTGEQIFEEPFAGMINSKEWNEQVAKYFKRYNALKDERAAVIFFAIALETELDLIHSIIFKGYNNLQDKTEWTFSMKIAVLKAFSIIPSDILTYSELIKNIRNVFAHQLTVDTFNDFEKMEKGKKYINQLNSYINSTDKELLVYSKISDTYINKYKDICALCIKSLRNFSPNVKLFIEKINSKDFKVELSNSAKEIVERKARDFDDNKHKYFGSSKKV